MPKVVIDAERCKACRYCVEACPKKLVQLGETINRLGYTPAVYDASREAECVSCALCAMMCPDTLIEVYKEEKIAKES